MSFCELLLIFKNFQKQIKMKKIPIITIAILLFAACSKEFNFTNQPAQDSILEKQFKCAMGLSKTPDSGLQLTGFTKVGTILSETDKDEVLDRILSSDSDIITGGSNNSYHFSTISETNEDLAKLRCFLESIITEGQSIYELEWINGYDNHTSLAITDNARGVIYDNIGSRALSIKSSDNIPRTFYDDSTNVEPSDSSDFDNGSENAHWNAYFNCYNIYNERVADIFLAALAHFNNGLFESVHYTNQVLRQNDYQINIGSDIVTVSGGESNFSDYVGFAWYYACGTESFTANLVQGKFYVTGGTSIVSETGEEILSAYDVGN